MQPSLDQILTVLELAKARTHTVAETHPEHDDVIRKFIKDLDQIGLELQEIVVGKASLQSSWRGSTVDGNIYNLINCLLPVTVFAEIIAEQQPEYTAPLKRFQEEIYRVKRELFKKVIPGAVSDED